MNVQSIELKLANNITIKLEYDEFNFIETNNGYTIDIPKEFINLPNPSLQNKVKVEYENISNDEFVTIPNYPLYKVNKNGDVMNAKTKKIVQQKHNDNGYHSINIRKNGKQSFVGVHRLVAETFLYNPLNLEHVDHLDHNPLNNKLTNLMWKSVSDNMFNRRYKDDLDKLPNGCTKIKSINNKSFDSLFYLNKIFYYQYSESTIRPYNYKPKNKTWNINKIDFTLEEFLKDYPQFKSDFYPK